MGFTTFRTKITDFEILKQALRDLGLNVKVDADVRGSGGIKTHADIVAVLEGSCDIGWLRNADGSYDMIADREGIAQKHNSTELINSINQKYAVNKTLAEIKRPGFQSSKPSKQLVLNIDVGEDSPTDPVVSELVRLCEAFNAYHIACGGTGLVIDDWEILVLAQQLMGV
jgi:hypothetical protein